MKIRQIVITAIALVILGGSFLLMNHFSSLKEPPKKVAVPEARKYVKTSTVKYEKVPTEVMAYGRVTSSLPLDVISEVQGKLIPGDVPLREGQRFSIGTLLFKIDDTEARLRLQATKSSFLRDVASILPDFKIDFPDSYETWSAYFRSIDLEKPLPELPVYKTDQEKTYLATKDIFSNYYTIKSTEANLQKHHVHAPFSGTISEVALQIGSFVNTGTRVGKITKTDFLELKVAVETQDIEWIRIGNEVRINSEDDTKNWRGRIVRIGDVVNENTQSIDVFVSIIPNEHKVYEGMYLRAEIPGATIQSAMEVPRTALLGSNQVYTVESDTLLKVKEVLIHKVNPETVVLSGLDEGADLVVESLVNAYNNMKVAKLKANGGGGGNTPGQASATAIPK